MSVKQNPNVSNNKMNPFLKGFQQIYMGFIL